MTKQADSQKKEDVTEFSAIVREMIAAKLLQIGDARMHVQNAALTSTHIIDYLLDSSAVPETDLAKFLANRLDLKYFDVTDIDPLECPIQQLDEKQLYNNRILPLRLDGDDLIVGIYHPSALQHTNFIKSGFKGQNINIIMVLVERSRLIDMLDLVCDRDQYLQNLDADVMLAKIAQESSPEPTREVRKVEQEEDVPVIQLIDKLLADAVARKASDLHFEPFEKSYRIRFRVDGILQLITKANPSVAVRMTARLKILSGMDIAEKRVPQDGRISIKLGTRSIDFRVNTLPTAWGEKIVLRILDASQAKMGIDSLGYEPEQKEMFLEALGKPQGMILITGPTGSGKTVSLYTGLNILNTIGINISTAEDPVEINLDGVNQVGINVKTGLTFASVLRALLRQDPDVIMVGEIRDLETAEIAIKAAQTGHMVLSTLHTNSAPETLTRLGNMGIPSFNIATSINLVIAQRLARRLCVKCKQPAQYPEKALLAAGFSQDEVRHPDFQIFNAVGCQHCRNGYSGRVGIYEVMKVTPEISRLIMDEANAIQIADASKRAGFNNLRRSGLNKVLHGLTTIQEVERVTSD